MTTTKKQKAQKVIDGSQSGSAVSGRMPANGPRGGFGVAVHATGAVRDPFFSLRPDGVKAIGFRLECGKSFNTSRVDGEDCRSLVYALDGEALNAKNLAALDGKIGYLEAGDFYSTAFLESVGDSFLGNGTRALNALGQIAVAKKRFSTLQFPTRLRVVAYGELAHHVARMASEGTEINVTGYGRTWKARKAKRQARRFELVAVYVHFVRGVDWPDGKPDLVAPSGNIALPARLAPSANITGLVVEPPYYQDDFLSLVVSAGWKTDLDAIVVLHAYGDRARKLRDTVKLHDLIQAECVVIEKKQRRIPEIRFAIRELAVLGHREVD